MELDNVEALVPVDPRVLGPQQVLIEFLKHADFDDMEGIVLVVVDKEGPPRVGYSNLNPGHVLLCAEALRALALEKAGISTGS